MTDRWPARREGAGGSGEVPVAASLQSVGLSQGLGEGQTDGQARAPKQPPPPCSHCQFQRKRCSLIRIIYKIMVHCLH